MMRLTDSHFQYDRVHAIFIAMRILFRLVFNDEQAEVIVYSAFVSAVELFERIETRAGALERQLTGLIDLGKGQIHTDIDLIFLDGIHQHTDHFFRADL